MTEADSKVEIGQTGETDLEDNFTKANLSFYKTSGEETLEEETEEILATIHLTGAKVGQGTGIFLGIFRTNGINIRRSRSGERQVQIETGSDVSDSEDMVLNKTGSAETK